MKLGKWMKMDENNEEDDKNEGELPDIFKIIIFSKHEIIKQQFLKAINAIDVFDSSKKLEIGVDFAFLLYPKIKFQFWSLSNKPQYEFLKYSYISGSRGIIYFYNIHDKIEENHLNLVIDRFFHLIPILFVGYDSVLPKNHEKIDQNIQLIKKYFRDHNSLYISMDKPDSMFQILDRIIHLDLVIINK